MNRNFKVKIFILIIIIFCFITMKNITSQAFNILLDNNTNVIKINVLLYKENDFYISLVRKSLEEIQEKNEGRVEFKFYDCQDNQSIQNEIMDKLLNNNDTDILLVNLVDPQNTKDITEKIKESKIPVVFFNREPTNMSDLKIYNKAYFVGTDVAEGGILQGNILVDAWNKTKMDKNEDKTMQYIMLMGEPSNIESIYRTKFSAVTINKAGIKTQELALAVCDWDKELAKQSFELLFLRYGSSVEAVISNNDEMALGVIEVLQKYGYNKGGKSEKIAVVGVDAIPLAQELIKKGEMTGSVFQDHVAMAEACYNIGMNLFYGKNPLEDINYKFDETEVAVRIPYKEYKG